MTRRAYHVPYLEKKLSLSLYKQTSVPRAPQEKKLSLSLYKQTSVPRALQKKRPRGNYQGTNKNKQLAEQTSGQLPGYQKNKKLQLCRNSSLYGRWGIMGYQGRNVTVVKNLVSD